MKVFPDTLPNPPRSWWREAREARNSDLSLRENIETETLIIGAGLTGLSCAYHLAKEDNSCVVIEAGEIGWGASGRNGGQVIPGLKVFPDEIDRLFPADLAERINEMAGASANKTFSLIEELGIECQHRRTGWVQGAHSKASLQKALGLAQQWQERGVSVTLLDREAIYEEVGGGDYQGGWIDHRGGIVQPYLYTRGLSEKVAQLGVRIYENTKGEKYRRSGKKWIVTCGEREVTCKNVVLATNGYSDDIEPAIRQSLVPVFSLIGVTEPLSNTLLEHIIPNRRAISETRRLLNYYHVDPSGRLVFGSASDFRHAPNHADSKWLKKEIEGKFSQLRDVKLDYVWSGRVAVTKQHIPVLQRVHDNVYAGYGFNGRGLALSTTMGEQLSLLVKGACEGELSFPLTLPDPYFLHSLHSTVGEALLRVYKLQDNLEKKFL